MVVPCLAGVDLPERVRRIVEGVGASAPCCGHCRRSGASLRCSRCQCVKYCSAACQRAHFKTHKAHCKSIAEKRTLAEKNWADAAPLDDGRSRGDETDLTAITDSSPTHLTTVTTIELADLLIKVGYRESDTVANGMPYYREALKYYLLPLQLLGKAYHRDYGWLEDRIVLMLVILGGDESHTRAWFTEIGGSRRAGHYLRSNRPSEIHDSEGNIQVTDTCDTVEGYFCDDLTFHAMLLLSQLKVAKLYEEYYKRLCAYVDAVKGQSPELTHVTRCIESFLVGEEFEDILNKQIPQIFLAFHRHDQHEFLSHLRDTIPLKPEHAPTLFSLAVHNAPARAPPELWMIYQDCFFENGLIEYLPEFEMEEEEGDGNGS